MVTLSALTLFLAQIIGLYMMLVGLSALVAPQRWQQMLDDYRTSPALGMISGVLVFAIGAALVHVHSILHDPLAIAVTAVGWAALLKGALLIAVPSSLMRLGRWSMRFIRIWAFLLVILGLLLGLAGLTGTAGVPSVV